MQNAENKSSFSQEFSCDSMRLSVSHMDWQRCARERRGDDYVFLVPLTGPACLRIGRNKLEAGVLEMVCVNPWQLWQLMPGEDTCCVAQLSCKAACVDTFYLELYGGSLGGFLSRPVKLCYPNYGVIRSYVSENRLDCENRSLMLGHIAAELFPDFLQCAVSAGAAVQRKKTFSPDVINAVIDYLNEHLENDITEEELARYVNISMGSMLRQFKQAAAATPMGYLIELRIERAKQLLAASDDGIEKIARMCGFESSANFTVTFKRKTGLSPSEFRQKAHLFLEPCLAHNR